jgi:photosystem II stability/assembly factor-like uncharacterized protein
VTGALANMTSECGNMSNLSAKPDEDLLIAGIAQLGLWASRDGGAWQAMGTGDGSAPITNRTSAIVYDPVVSTRFWESGIYNAGGVYETTDDGMTFSALGTVHHCDLVSIDFTDPNRQTLLAGGHEETQTVYLSTNGGTTWTNVGGGLPATAECTNPLIIDSQTFLVGCTNSGIYRTTDGAVTWTQVTKSGGSSAPLRASDGTIYWAGSASGLTSSTDEGQHWTDPVGTGTLTGVHPIELPGGTLATLSTQSVVVSSDRGTTWSPASTALPYGDAVGLVYSSQRKAFYIWHFTCANGPVLVPTDAIMRFDPN